MGFLRDNWEIILSSLLTVASFVYFIIQKVRTGKKAEVLSKLKAMIPSLVREAESIIKGDKMGAVRENYVLTNAMLLASENKVKVDALDLRKAIEEEVKTLNYNRVEDTPSETASVISDNENDDVKPEVVGII